jgi:hypothetical protein
MGRIALGWLKDELFHKDVTTRALAAGIVALGAYFFALGAGYVSTPTGVEAAKGVVNVVGSVVIAALAAWADGSYTGRPTRVRTESVQPHRQVRVAIRRSRRTSVGYRFEGVPNTLLALRHAALQSLTDPAAGIGTTRRGCRGLR